MSLEIFLPNCRSTSTEVRRWTRNVQHNISTQMRHMSRRFGFNCSPTTGFFHVVVSADSPSLGTDIRSNRSYPGFEPLPFEVSTRNSGSGSSNSCSQNAFSFRSSFRVASNRSSKGNDGLFRVDFGHLTDLLHLCNRRAYGPRSSY
jgi:hypothetical protein